MSDEQNESTDVPEDDKTENGEETAPETEEDASVGPPEDIENDPAYNPDDEELKGIKGG